MLFLIQIVCGNSHVLALSDDGKLIGWGSNNYGQLGTGSRSSIYQTPIITAIDIGRIIDIAASPSCHTSAALTLNGEIYVWGQYRGIYQLNSLLLLVIYCPIIIIIIIIKSLEIQYTRCG